MSSSLMAIGLMVGLIFIGMIGTLYSIYNKRLNRNKK